MVGHEGRTGLTKALLSSSSGPIIPVIHHRSPRQLSYSRSANLLKGVKALGGLKGRDNSEYFFRLILPLASLNVEAISN